MLDLRVKFSVKCMKLRKRYDEYKNGKMSSRNFKIVAVCEGLAILGMIFFIISG